MRTFSCATPWRSCGVTGFEPKVQMLKEVTDRVAWLQEQSVQFRKDYLLKLSAAHNGIFTKDALATIGIGYPPARGWRKRFTDGDRIGPKGEKVNSQRAERKRRKQKRRKEKKIKRVAAQAQDEFLASYAWRKLRYSVLVAYGARCMACGRTPKDGVKMHVDHIKPRRLYPELALVRSNLQILCEECNHGKGNWDQTDWRPST